MPTTSEAEERHISRRPERTIVPSAIHRSWPPSPRTAVHHPAAVVIWRPAPRLIADPSPSVRRLPHPITITVWNPISRLVRHPNLSVVRLVFPASVGIQVFRASVVLIGMIPRLRAVDHVVAVAVPAVPIVADGSFRDFVLCFFGASTDRRHLALLHFGNTLWRRYLRFPFPPDATRAPIGPPFSPHNTYLL